MRKFGPVKEKNLVPVLPDSKAQWLDNHVADMLHAICSDDYFTRPSWRFNLSILQHVSLLLLIGKGKVKSAFGPSVPSGGHLTPVYVA